MLPTEFPCDACLNRPIRVPSTCPERAIRAKLPLRRFRSVSQALSAGVELRAEHKTRMAKFQPDQF